MSGVNDNWFWMHLFRMLACCDFSLSPKQMPIIYLGAGVLYIANSFSKLSLWASDGEESSAYGGNSVARQVLHSNLGRRIKVCDAGYAFAVVCRQRRN